MEARRWMPAGHGNTVTLPLHSTAMVAPSAYSQPKGAGELVPVELALLLCCYWLLPSLRRLPVSHHLQPLLLLRSLLLHQRRQHRLPLAAPVTPSDQQSLLRQRQPLRSVCGRCAGEGEGEEGGSRQQPAWHFLVSVPSAILSFCVVLEGSPDHPC